ncbi:esterase/lipase family protein [Nocardioides antri]|uniref:Alpha/beta hydrolase n=1 Tax=Nocardioides antri TaxID=2607659 RepID=A0A5B1M2C1_9ACTN|nr:alpha/beta fold hydrolase [Nocardioides antri]KAA1427335.1 alpha/beta hydrolase [Nocardioides antri]
MTSVLAPYLLPDGFGRPALAALLREGSVVTEAGRLAVQKGSARRTRRRTPYAARGVIRAAEPVLLVPGFLAGDWTLLEMAAGLRQRGFRTYRSHIRANVSCTLKAAALVESQLERIADRRGSRVQIVGHSLGGMIARGIAVRRPDLVSGIVTMGSPMLAPAAHHRLLTGSVTVLNRLSAVGLAGFMSAECVSGPCAETSFHEVREPLPEGVAMTNIYSRRDGIVDWKACIDPQGVAIQVRASHIGMALDPRVVLVVGDALARHTAGVATLSAVESA